MRMTKEEALKLKRFDEYCTCGGYAHSMNGRNPADPHAAYCPQRKQYLEWYIALHENIALATPTGQENE